VSVNSELTNLTEQVPILGIALILCLFAGKMAAKVKVPKVTAFLLVGVVLGPSVLNLLTPEISHSLFFINEIALGLILFNIGGEFHKKLLKDLGKKQALYSFTLAFLIFSSVAFLVFFVTSFTSIPLKENIIISLFLGMVACDVAPPTTLLVMKEYNAQGKLSLCITVFLAIGTGFAIVGSRVLNVIYSMLGYWGSNSANVGLEILLFFWSLLGSVIFGVLLGFILSFFEQRETKHGEILLAVACTILFGQSISYYLKTDPLIISLIIGATLVNASRAGKKIHSTIKEMGLSLYAIFFVLAGSHIHFQTQIKTMGLIGLTYIAARTIGVIFSANFAAYLLKAENSIRQYAGFSFLSHAGAALAIILPLRVIEAESAQMIVAIVTTSIFVFEIVGPISLRYALSKSNEIDRSLVNKNGQSMNKIKMSFQEQWKNFLINIGLKEETINENIIHIHELMSTDLLTINESSNTQTVLNFINEHTQDCYPIIDDEGRYIGLIDMEALHNVINDDSHSLILAKTLIRSNACLDETASFEEAKEKFKLSNLDYLPIINKDTKKLLGVISLKKLVLSQKKGSSNL